MPNPTVSIITPVYGVENYIVRFVESVQKQTFKNWELFLVDDGSRDRSGEICDECAKNDERIKVIHKENGGAPSARNTAIDLANGKYLVFMDPDDWAEPFLLEDMIREAETIDAQMVVAGFYIDTYYSDTEKFTQEQFVPSRRFFSKQEFREYAHVMFDASLLYPPWNKLVRTDYITRNSLYFPDTFWDDLPWNLSVIRDIERVSVLENRYYHFIRQRLESEGAKYRPNLYEKREEEQDWMEELFSYWGVDNKAVREFLSRRYAERIIGCVENLTNSNCTEPFLKKLKEIHRIINSDRVRDAVSKTVPNSKHMRLMLIPIKRRLIFLTFLEGKVISGVKKNNMKVFAELKANR